MAPRKDMMRIIRQDAGFSAKLGFGGALGAIATAREVGMSETPEARIAAAAGEPVIRHN